MSTAVWDGQILACDSKIVDNDCVSAPIRKFHEVRVNMWITYAGDMRLLERFIDWCVNKQDESPPMGNYSVLMVNGRQCREFHCEVNGSWGFIPVSGAVAIGSGYKFALAAIECGRDAVEAVQIASKLDPYTGGDIYYVDTRDNRQGVIDGA